MVAPSKSTRIPRTLTVSGAAVLKIPGGGSLAPRTCAGPGSLSCRAPAALRKNPSVVPHDRERRSWTRRFGTHQGSAVQASLPEAVAGGQRLKAGRTWLQACMRNRVPIGLSVSRWVTATSWSIESGAAHGQGAPTGGPRCSLTRPAVGHAEPAQASATAGNAVRIGARSDPHEALHAGATDGRSAPARRSRGCPRPDAPAPAGEQANPRSRRAGRSSSSDRTGTPRAPHGGWPDVRTAERGALREPCGSTREPPQPPVTGPEFP